jgi:uncharacterized RDD family membrane protein YckC
MMSGYRNPHRKATSPSSGVTGRSPPVSNAFIASGGHERKTHPLPFCVKCGRQLGEADRFCPSCGNPVAGNVQGPSYAGPAPSGAYVSGIDALTKERSVQSYWFERLIAFVIDAVVVFVAVGIIAALLILPSFIGSLVSGGNLNFAAVLGTSVYSLINSVALVLYFALAESLYGATLGKSVMGLKVVTLEGRVPSLEQALIRDFSKINWVLLLLDVVFGLATDKEYRQKFSDRYARTLVQKRV